MAMVWASWATVADDAFATYGAIVPAAVTLQCQEVRGQFVLTWTAGTLQSAPAVAVHYKDIADAASPYAFTPSGAQQYFRVKVQ
jgi:hypothetical protein